jgi:hypothetical protein
MRNTSTPRSVPKSRASRDDKLVTLRENSIRSVHQLGTKKTPEMFRRPATRGRVMPTPRGRSGTRSRRRSLTSATRAALLLLLFQLILDDLQNADGVLLVLAVALASGDHLLFERRCLGELTDL